VGGGARARTKGAFVFVRKPGWQHLEAGNATRAAPRDRAGPHVIFKAQGPSMPSKSGKGGRIVFRGPLFEETPRAGRPAAGYGLDSRRMTSL
jgi:hypothetical protein